MPTTIRTLVSSLAVIAATSIAANAQQTSSAQDGDNVATVETTKSEVSFTAADGTSRGTAELVGTPSGLLIRLDLRDLPPDEWVAFHIHEGGECNAENGFDSAQGHWNAGNVPHGYLAESGPHSGDMPNMYVRGDGRLLADVFNQQAFLSGETANVMGRTLILHSGADDYRSQPSGDAGERLACAVIE